MNQSEPQEMASEPGDLEEQMKKALAVKAACERALLQKAHVVGVGVGLRQQGGEYTQTVSLVVIVEEKLAISELNPADILPGEVDGIPVDVQEVGQIGTH
jgi:hypothetical protein